MQIRRENGGPVPKVARLRLEDGGTQRVRREGRGPVVGFHGVTANFTHASLVASSGRYNQDRALVLERGDDLVVVVADGAGGMSGGGAASDAVMSTVTTAVRDPAFVLHADSSWKNLLLDLDAQLATTMTGETTAAVVVVGAAGLLGASVGDSQAWVLDHTCADDLTVGQNKKRLGSGRASPVSFFRPRLDGALVVGTDGLWNYVSMKQVAEVVCGRAPVDAGEELRALVRLPSGKYQDDVGIVVVTSA